MMGEKAIRGLAWGYATFAFERLGNLVITVVLARLLVPADFGLFAAAAVIVGLIDTFGQIGVKEALIYQLRLTDRARNTGFLLDLSIGALQWAAIFFGAPLGLRFIDDPMIVPVLQILAFVPLISALSRTQEAFLQRELLFKRRYICDLLAVACKLSVCITLAFFDYGVWSLVIAQLAGMSLRTLLQWCFTGWLPGLSVSIDDAKRIFSYGGHVFVTNFIGMLATRCDQLLIGGMLGQVALGYYFIGTRIPELILLGFGMVLSQIIFPILARAQDCHETLMESFFAATRYAAYAVVPLALGCVAVAPELIHVFFGEQWTPTVPLMQIFALVGLVQMLPWVAGDTFKAVGRPDIVTKLSLIQIVIAIPMLYAFIHFGQDVLYAASAVLIAAVGCSLLRLWYASRFLCFSPAVYLSVIGKPLMAGVMMLVGVYLWRIGLGASIPVKLLLASSVALGVVLYGLALWLIDRQRLSEAWTFVMATMIPPKDVARAGAVAASGRPPAP